MNVCRRIFTLWPGRPSRFAIALAIAAPMACGLFNATAEPALAGERRKVRWSKLYLRNYPQGRAWAQLYKGQSFEVYEYRPSGWARGRAYGHINTDKSPYPAPYNDVWVETAGLE